MNPQLYATRDKVLWAYFEHSCFEAEAFLEEYGVVMALISQGSPISIYGNVHGLEGGRLSAAFPERTCNYASRMFLRVISI